MTTHTVEHEGVTYALSPACPERFVVQHAGTGDYLYPYPTRDAAWEAELAGEGARGWISDYLSVGVTIEECKLGFLGLVGEYTRADALASVADGYGWAISLGLVAVVPEVQG